MNTAKVLHFPASPGGQEQRVADTDDGYTRLANELYEELIGANLTRTQAKVAHAVCRKTYGFNKKMDRIADSQIAELCRITRSKANVAKNELIKMGVLITEGRLIGPNKNLSQWNIADCSQIENIVPKQGTKGVPKAITGIFPNREHTKDTITKDKKDINSSSRHSGECQNGPSEKFLAKHPEAVGGCFTPSGKLWGTADDLTAAKWIYARVSIVNASLPEPSWPAWTNEVRLLRTTREQTHKQICEVFKWANSHHFWAANVLCPAKLRKQWDTLVTQKAQQPNATKQKAPELNWDNRDWADKLPPGVL